jgi:hypothetical protein
MFPLKVFYQERNRYLMLLKTFKWATLLALSPVLLVAEVITWGFVLLHDRRNIGNKLRAYSWVIRNWRRILDERAATQATRKVKDRELLLRTSFKLDFVTTSPGPVSRIAQAIFDPLFFLLRTLVISMVRW